ncbi:MAG: hypothetical protein MUW56_07105 [Chryseobacterium sp.]|uniref:hypothetical protein n=1 Tax=Chryseobacterium sp. TaxID=1871047 RepID=UPI0025C2871C|nr:hypothetical protein [Chryseobacterium sp.]MCJ7933401.1 hypothetical protein [Chryseobacterium sp.]
MDKNYFFSYGYTVSTAFLVVMPAVGNINVRFIAALSGPEKRARLNIRNNNPQNLVDHSVCSGAEGTATLAIVKNTFDGYERIDYGIKPFNSSGKILYNHSSIAGNGYLPMLSRKDLQIENILHNIHSDSIDNPYILDLSEKFTIFYKDFQTGRWI